MNFIGYIDWSIVVALVLLALLVLSLLWSSKAIVTIASCPTCGWKSDKNDSDFAVKVATIHQAATGHDVEICEEEV